MSYPIQIPQRTAAAAGVDAVPVEINANASTARVAVRDALNANSIKAVAAYGNAGLCPYELIHGGALPGNVVFGLIEANGKAFLELSYFMRVSGTPSFSTAPSVIVYGMRTMDREFGPFSRDFNANFPVRPQGNEDSGGFFGENAYDQLWLPLMNNNGDGIVQTFSTTRIYRQTVGAQVYAYLDPIYLKTRGFARFLVVPTAGAGSNITEANILAATTG